MSDRLSRWHKAHLAHEPWFRALGVRISWSAPVPGNPGWITLCVRFASKDTASYADARERICQALAYFGDAGRDNWVLTETEPFGLNNGHIMAFVSVARLDDWAQGVFVSPYS